SGCGSAIRPNVPCRAPHWAHSDSGKTGWSTPKGSPEAVTTVTARAARREPSSSLRTGRGAEPWRKKRPPTVMRSSWRAVRSAARGEQGRVAPGQGAAAGGQRVVGEGGGGPGPGGGAHGRAEGRVGEQPGEGRGDGPGVAGVDDESGRTVVDGLPGPAAAAG